MQPESTSTDTLDPALEERAQAGQTAIFTQGGEEHLFLELGVVLPDDGDLQFFARAEVGEDARLAHLHDIGEGADRQALEPHVRGQAQGRLEDGGAGLLAFLQLAGGVSQGLGGRAHGLVEWNERSFYSYRAFPGMRAPSWLFVTFF
jgi:hypothetical protein